MDPIALATAATALLSPYIAKFAEKGAEKLGESLPDGIGKLWTSIGEKFKGKPAAEEAAKDLAAKPDDADNQAAFRKELKKTLTDDEDFQKEFLQLLKSAQSVHVEIGDVITGDNNQWVKGNYGSIIHTTGDVEIKSGDVNVNNSQGGGDLIGHDKVTSGK